MSARVRLVGGKTPSEGRVEQLVPCNYRNNRGLCLFDGSVSGCGYKPYKDPWVPVTALISPRLSPLLRAQAAMLACRQLGYGAGFAVDPLPFGTPSPDVQTVQLASCTGSVALESCLCESLM